MLLANVWKYKFLIVGCNNEIGNAIRGLNTQAHICMTDNDNEEKSFDEFNLSRSGTYFFLLFYAYHSNLASSVSLMKRWSDTYTKLRKATSKGVKSLIKSLTM